MYTEKVTYIFIKLKSDYLSKLLFSASGLSSLVLPPLVCLSLGEGVIEILDKRLKTRCDQLKNKSSRRVTYGNPCYIIGSKANSIYFLNDRSV
jgi:hypothetical protein